MPWRGGSNSILGHAPFDAPCPFKSTSTRPTGNRGACKISNAPPLRRPGARLAYTVLRCGAVTVSPRKNPHTVRVGGRGRGNPAQALAKRPDAPLQY